MTMETIGVGDGEEGRWRVTATSYPAESFIASCIGKYFQCHTVRKLELGTQEASGVRACSNQWHPGPGCDQRQGGKPSLWTVSHCGSRVRLKRREPLISALMTGLAKVPPPDLVMVIGWAG